MGIRAVRLVGFALVALFVSPALVQGAQDARGIEAVAFEVLDAFMLAFNARDLEAFEATFHFPHFRLASDDSFTVLPEAGGRAESPFDALVATGWHHSAWLERKVVQRGEDKVHVAVVFARYRTDGTELSRFDSLYVITRVDGRWGVKGRSSFAP